MTSHPVNLGIRFILELAALVTLGYWGWEQGNGGWRYLWVWVLPLTAAALWGTFAVPDDPSRSGKAPIPVPGIIRLLFEFALFALAVWMLVQTGWVNLGIILGVVVVLHYAASYDRITWLFKN